MMSFAGPPLSAAPTMSTMESILTSFVADFLSQTGERQPPTKHLALHVKGRVTIGR